MYKVFENISLMSLESHRRDNEDQSSVGRRFVRWPARGRSDYSLNESFKEKQKHSTSETILGTPDQAGGLALRCSEHEHSHVSDIRVKAWKRAMLEPNTCDVKSCAMCVLLFFV